MSASGARVPGADLMALSTQKREPRQAREGATVARKGVTGPFLFCLRHRQAKRARACPKDPAWRARAGAGARRFVLRRAKLEWRSVADSGTQFRRAREAIVPRPADFFFLPAHLRHLGIGFPGGRRVPVRPYRRPRMKGLLSLAAGARKRNVISHLARWWSSSMRTEYPARLEMRASRAPARAVLSAERGAAVLEHRRGSSALPRESGSVLRPAAAPSGGKASRPCPRTSSSSHVITAKRALR